ncbi:heme-binding protein [Rhodobacteraceae bacterium RKSG542]|uniref:GlcG/HbpS family heme-binding protein n=1 Tax=Pseudovibrio flavus TaxID=2529854 RepID=UPI0012BC3503|nr:heme-binding protein [Pseudovibrio flavus]MTI18367.1 heme-binding protein [Pseudovibrio flavus]
MTQFNLSAAKAIIAKAQEKAAELGLKPITVAVLDAGGHVVAMERQDGSSLLRPQIAHGKAFGALSVGAGSRWLNENAVSRPHFVQALNGLAGGNIVPVPGGVLAKDASTGAILGAVGITGDTSENDEACAIAGIAAGGFQPDVG